MENRIELCCDFLNTAHSPFHVAHGVAKQLEQAGYQRLFETDPWELVPGGKYYVMRGSSTVIAFRIPTVETPTGFMISASHSDHPTFQVKDDLTLSGRYSRLSVEKYGGMIISSWLDRPLSLAGRVLVQTEDGIQEKLLDIDEDLLLIPNVAIHMNRQINEGYRWNPVTDIIPLIGGPEAADKFKARLEEAAGGTILGHDLVLYIRQKPSVWGVDREYISAAALDDLACAFCCTEGFLEAEESKAIPVLCIFDNEEVGSASFQGAAGTLLRDVLKRILELRNLDWNRMATQSFMVSADNGHAVHPNHPELADAGNAPVVNGGVTLKFNSNRRYTTDGLSAAIFRSICAKAGVPVQNYYNRADIPGGSTLGSVSQTHVTIPSVDIGLAQLAMHSCFETAGVKDVNYLCDAMKAYYSCALEVSNDGTYTLE